MEHAQGFNEDISPQEFAARNGIKIQNLSLLTRALTHRSYVNEHSDALEDNERLEFLGDAVLDFLVGAWLYNHFPEMREGDLTRMRSSLVRTEQLAKFGESLGIGGALRLGRGESENGGRLRPALICAAFEALTGAIYLEGGIPAVREFIVPKLEAAVGQTSDRLHAPDPKSRLQEWAQSLGYGTPIYNTVRESGPDHAKTFEIEVLVEGRRYGTGSGTSKSMAEKNAAQQALDTLNLLP